MSSPRPLKNYELWKGREKIPCLATFWKKLKEKTPSKLKEKNSITQGKNSRFRHTKEGSKLCRKEKPAWPIPLPRIIIPLSLFSPAVCKFSWILFNFKIKSKLLSSNRLPKIRILAFFPDFARDWRVFFWNVETFMANSAWVWSICKQTSRKIAKLCSLKT